MYGVSVPLERRIFLSASQEISHILWKPENPLPPLQEPATCPDPEADQSTCSSCHPIFLKIHCNISFRFTSASSKGSLSLSVPHKNPLSIYPIPHTCSK